jgi:hypothetical protein
MNAKERLQAVQAALQDRDVHDVKFCLAKGVSENSASDVMGKVADFMEAYSQGKCVELTAIGNTQLRA